MSRSIGHTKEPKVAIVTGASRGLGKAIADLLEESGYVVERWSKHATEKSQGVDVTDRDEVRCYVGEAIKRHGRIDLVVNNAGINRRTDFEDIYDDEWDEVLGVNLKGPFIVTQEAWLALKLSRGNVVNIASVSALWHGPWTFHYAVSKAGLISLTKCLAREGAPHGIRVNAVAPGLCRTDLTADEVLSARGQELVYRTLLQRLIEPAEVAQAVLYLAEATALTGQVLGVHGGAVL